MVEARGQIRKHGCGPEVDMDNGQPFIPFWQGILCKCSRIYDLSKAGYHHF
jgi:hypothetical protein